MSMTWWIVGAYVLVGLACAALFWELMTGGLDRQMEQADSDTRREHELIQSALESSEGRRRAAPMVALAVVGLVVAWPVMLGGAAVSVWRDRKGGS